MCKCKFPVTQSLVTGFFIRSCSRGLRTSLLRFSQKSQMRNGVMCVSLKHNHSDGTINVESGDKNLFLRLRNVLAFTAPVYTKCALIKFLWTFLVPHFIQIGRKVWTVRVKVYVMYITVLIAPIFTRPTETQ